METYKVDVKMIDDEGIEMKDTFDALNYLEILELYAMIHVLRFREYHVLVQNNGTNKSISIDEFIIFHTLVIRLQNKESSKVNFN